MKWLAIHGANSFGYDKVSFEDRVTWARDNTAHIEACANDPQTLALLYAHFIRLIKGSCINGENVTIGEDLPIMKLNDILERTYPK